MPKLEIKGSIPNCRLIRIEKPTNSSHPIFSIKPSNAEYIESIVKVIAEIDCRNSVEILNPGLKTLDNSINRI